MSSYCSGCHKITYCGFPCGEFLNWLSIMGECLKGSPLGEDPCANCHQKGDFDCPLYGDDKQSFVEYEPYLNEDLPPMSGE
jgi:hypothetical protein